MQHNQGKLTVKRILDMKMMNTNMNFYQMNVKSEVVEKERKKTDKMQLFKSVSGRLKTFMESSPSKTKQDNAWLKAGPDPLMKSQTFSEFVERPEELWNIELPKPK